MGHELTIKLKITPLLAQDHEAVVYQARILAAPDKAIPGGTKLVSLIASLLKDEYQGKAGKKGPHHGETAVYPDGSIEITFSRIIDLRSPPSGQFDGFPDRRGIDARHLFIFDPHLIFDAARIKLIEGDIDVLAHVKNSHLDKQTQVPESLVLKVADLLAEISHQLSTQLSLDPRGFRLELEGISLPLKTRQRATLAVVEEKRITIPGLVRGVLDDKQCALLMTNWDSDKPRVLSFRADKEAFRRIRRTLLECQRDGVVTDLVIRPLAKRAGNLAGELISASPSVNCERDLAGTPTALLAMNPASRKLPALSSPGRIRRSCKKDLASPICRKAALHR